MIDSRARFPFDLPMADSPRLTRARQTEQQEREERLARALRENLRRRKAQVRAKEAPASDQPAQPDVDAARS